MRIQRLFDRLHMYNYTMQYRPGKFNCLANMLSRKPMTDDVANEACDELDIDSIFGGMQLLISGDEASRLKLQRMFACLKLYSM
jgi:hypothetical protein